MGHLTQEIVKPLAHRDIPPHDLSQGTKSLVIIGTKA